MTRAGSQRPDEPFRAKFGKRGELRQPVGRTGRAHLDRWLPFIVLHRSSDPSHSIARRVAVNSPAYLIWSPEDDLAARQAIEALAPAIADHFGRMLVLTVADSEWQPVAEGSQQLAPFDDLIGASAGPSASRAVDCLADSLKSIRLDLRAPEVHKTVLDEAVARDAQGRPLARVSLSILEDPLLERLLSEKRQELDHQLTMLATRNTPAFQAASLLQYGTVSSRLLEDARAILARPDGKAADGERLGAAEVAEAARQLVAQYRSVDPRFEAAIEVRDDVASLLVSGEKLMIASNTSMLRSRLEALLAHEVSVHLLTYFNGSAQGLTVFRTGLAGYEGVQEGLGVFAEWAVGGLSEARMRLLAGRVVAVAAMLDGAEFVEVYRTLTRDHGLGRNPSFHVAARVFRSGGFAKDMIYLKGFQNVVELVGSGASLRPFWIGKIAPGHVGAIEELLQRELVRPPVFEPLFLERRDVADRLARLRARSSFDAILDVE